MLSKKSLLAILIALIGSSCSHKSLQTSCNSFCEQLPDIDKESFIFNIEHKTFNDLIQVKALKDCGCLEPEKQAECYAKFQ